MNPSSPFSADVLRKRAVRIGIVLLVAAGIAVWEWYQKRQADRRNEAVAAQREQPPAELPGRERSAANGDDAVVIAIDDPGHDVGKPEPPSADAVDEFNPAHAEAPVNVRPDVKPVGPAEKKASPIAKTPAKPPVAKPAAPPGGPPAGPPPGGPKKYLIQNVSIRDLNGKVVYRGNVDITATLDRIAAGKTLSFRNDGITFQNREGRLPRKPPGHYREWVHPTPQLNGPGPQRIVTGEDGEAYYTYDHYRSFKRVK